MRYKLVEGIRLEALDNVWASFSPLSGETQVLNTEAAAVLELLASGGACEDEVATALADDAAVEPAAVNEALRHIWEQLTAAGLVERALQSEHNRG